MKRSAQVAVGKNRSDHAAAIRNSQRTWEKYSNTHMDSYSSVGEKKYVIVNTEGNVLQRAEDPKLLTVNGTLRHEDFLTIQDMVTEVRRRSLNGIADLQSRGLSFSVDIEEQLVGFESLNEFQAAKQEMNPNSYQNNDTVYTEDYVPNPITHQSFGVPWRQKGFDYKRSAGMSESIRQVAERLEDTLFNGNTDIAVTFSGTQFPIYGYTTHPNRGTGTISDWSNIANIENVVPELITQIGGMFSGQGGVGNNSVVVYVANDIWVNLQNDYKAEVTGSVLERIMKIPQVLDVKPAEKLANTQVVLVEMERRTVELAQASDIISVPHQIITPFASQDMTTYAAMVQQIKVDSNGNTGIRHLTI